MATAKPRHVLFITLSAYGHFRPFIPLAARLVHERRDVIVTFAAMLFVKQKLEDEIERYFTDDEKALKNNIRILYLKYPENLETVANTNPFELISVAFADVYPAMHAEQPISCATGRTYQAFRPDVILVDIFYLYRVLRTIREVSGNVIPVLGLVPASLTATLRFCGPSSLGGMGITPSLVEARMKETGKSIDTVLSELYQPQSGEVIKLPGLPAMYDYEFNPHGLDERTINSQNHTYASAAKFLEECDGLVTTGNISLQLEVYAVYKTWFAPRPAFFFGPLLPEETPLGDKLSHSQEKELKASSNGGEVKRFLDTIKQTHGEHSLLYISFGSIIWPSGNDIWRVLEVVLEMKIPLILSFRQKIAAMPPHLQTQLQASELVRVSEWAPQQLILKHQATGWFLTHCGNNSVHEAVYHGVPMIAWPLSTDQPFNAAYISSTLGIGYELFETKVGAGLRPLCRGIRPEGTPQAIEAEIRSIFTKAWGLDGAQKRKAIQALSRKVNKAWDEDGEARNEFREFLKRFLPVNDNLWKL